MTAENRARRLALAVAAAGLCLVLVAQLLAGLTPVAANGVATGQALGQAGFVYLTGFRSTLAGILWKRVDEQGDTYYNVDLGTQKYILPTVRIVTMLDPHYTEPYFVGQWVIARQGDPKLALSMTEEGLANNPDSGILRYSMAQLLDTFFNHDPRAYEWAVKAVSADSKWRSTEEKYTGYAVARDILERFGDLPRAAEVTKVLDYLKTPDAKLAPTETTTEGSRRGAQ